MPHDSLATLAGAAQAGDDAAREVLFVRAARLAYVRPYHAVDDSDAAGDAAQAAGSAVASRGSALTH